LKGEKLSSTGGASVFFHAAVPGSFFECKNCAGIKGLHFAAGHRKKFYGIGLLQEEGGDENREVFLVFPQ